MTKRACLALLLLAACGQPPLRLAVPAVPVTESIPSGFASAVLRDVSLPAYAAEDRIFVQGAGNALTPISRSVWADTPERALTLDLARALGSLTGARIAPEPWPFQEPPEAEIDVRVAEFAPDLTRSAFVIRSQVFVASQDGSGRDRAQEFLVTAPLPPEPGPAAIAAARAQATLALARQIAAEGLR